MESILLDWTGCANWPAVREQLSTICRGVYLHNNHARIFGDAFSLKLSLELAGFLVRDEFPSEGEDVRFAIYQ